MMKFKKEYALLGIVILGLLTYLFLNQQDRIHYALPEIPRLDTADITQFTVTNAGTTITLIRQKDQWRLSPGDHAADTAQVERMLKSVAELEITALVSEAQSYARYELDADRRIDVEVFTDGQRARRVAIGKAASTFRHTHVIVDDDKKVYHASGSFRWEFDKSIDDLRDKTVLAFDRDAITRIAIQADAQEQVIQKTPQTQDGAASDGAPSPPDEDQGDTPAAVQWVTAEGQTLANAVVDELLAALNPLKCKDFIDDDQKASLDNPRYRIQLTGASTRRLEIFNPRPKRPTDFPGTSTDSPQAFVLSEFDVEKIKRFYEELNENGGDAPSPAQTEK